jgi:hypothetical protein
MTRPAPPTLRIARLAPHRCRISERGQLFIAVRACAEVCIPGATYGALRLAGASLIRDEATWLKRRKSVNTLLVLMILLIWLLMNHHGLFVQPP